MITNFVLCAPVPRGPVLLAAAGQLHQVRELGRL
jgi:hypothetical protein